MKAFLLAGLLLLAGSAVGTGGSALRGGQPVLLDPMECGPVHARLFFGAAAAFFPPEALPYWCVLSAQARAESGYRLDAVSPAGAEGLPQFMPGTWREVCTPMFGLEATPYQLVPAVMCQGKYMGRLMAFWVWERPVNERVKLALACYNAGCGHIHKAQKLCSGARLWHEIQPCLRRVTGHHSEETTAYVARIERFYREFTGRTL